MPKAAKDTAMRQTRRHNPLQDDIMATGLSRNKPSKKPSKHASHGDGQAFVDSQASSNILRIGRELAAEDRLTSEACDAVNPFALDSRFVTDGDNQDPDWDDYETWGGEQDEIEDNEVDPADLEAWRRFNPDDDDLLKYGWDGKPADADADAGEAVNLGKLIYDKIMALPQFHMRQEPGAPDSQDDFPPRVVDAYTKVGQILSRYRSGPLPKIFKILPTIPQWEAILQLTRPESWTPSACFQATRIFVSHNPLVVQRFLEMVLLEKVRDDVYENKKLNPHLFNALKKALYKPAAFFKGFLLPLARSGTCTLLEARIVSAALVRVSIPVLYSGAAINCLCEIAAEETCQESNAGGAINILIKALLDKRYALPYQVIDALVFHFLRFRTSSAPIQDESKGAHDNSQAKLPVIWHQSLLVFAQRYKNDITEDQREALLDLLLTRGHVTIGPEVRRELLAGRGRGVAMMPQSAEWDGDDTMDIDAESVKMIETRAAEIKRQNLG
ncbi:hypothetical protein CDD82_4800 [Ophiocordyceps australis]|uniref:Bystin n=1 Tax=Ophiocordyceps australis TaxID=1399860 RepID=A0A2C5Z421_9HYPO|nr:hypothetical protein CDD82_4800 [Ophiocordyceps australis]